MHGLRTATSPSSPPRVPSWGRVARWGAAPLVLLWLAGFAGFLLARGRVEQTLPRREEPPRGEHNVAAYRYGPRLRASSYHRDASSHHHPAFVVDERARPSLTEKWVSAFNDPEPWLEVHWREPRDVRRVRLLLAGVVEGAALNMRSYRLQCLGGAGGPTLSVTDNQASLAEHELRCRGATGLRAEFTLGPRDDRARVFEVEVLGQ